MEYGESLASIIKMRASQNPKLYFKKCELYDLIH